MMRLGRALNKVESLYRLSAMAHDFRKECIVLGIRAPIEDDILKESFSIMMDPFPVGDKNDPIALDELIDEIYPGMDCSVERSEGHAALLLNKKTAS